MASTNATSHEPISRPATSQSQRSRPVSRSGSRLSRSASRPVSRAGSVSSRLSRTSSHRLSRRYSFGPGDDAALILDADGPTMHDLESMGLHRSASTASMVEHGDVKHVSRRNTLKKKSSIRRSSSKRSLRRRGSLGGIGAFNDEEGERGDEVSVFWTPVPTGGAPTEKLAARFQGEWERFACC